MKQELFFRNYSSLQRSTCPYTLLFLLLRNFDLSIKGSCCGDPDFEVTLILCRCAGAMDDELLQVLIEKGIPSFAMSSNLTLEDFGWGSATFNKMGREKINLIQAFTRWGQDVIVSDVDTVWMRNPVPYMNKVRALKYLNTRARHFNTFCTHDSSMKA